MTQHYRETDPVSARWTGNTSGAPLSAFQGDENIYLLVQAIAAVAATVTPSRTVSSISFDSGTNELTFIMSDSTMEGPFTIEPATFVDRGAWAPSTSYNVNDSFSINGTLYRVLFAHTSALTFSAGANDGAGHNYYSAMLSLPGAALPTGGATGQALQKSSGSDFAVTWGYKLPTGGTARQYLIKQSSTNQDAIFDAPQATDIHFTPSTASGLTSSNVSDAIEEVEAKIAIEISGITATEVTFSPSTASTLTSTNVADALDELANKILTETDAFSDLTGTIGASQRDATITALGTTGTVSLDPSLGDVFTITPTGGVTLNAASAPANAKITLIVTTSGTSSFNITPTTNFKSTGALASGTVNGKTFTISFVGDGTNLCEVSRTVAM